MFDRLSGCILVNIYVNILVNILAIFVFVNIVNIFYRKSCKHSFSKNKNVYRMFTRMFTKKV